jgi:hypothetical protein
VRELPRGQRPSDWANDANDANLNRDANLGRDEHDAKLDRAPNLAELPELVDGATANQSADSVSPTSSLPAPARVDRPWSALPRVTGPQQYQVQFSTTEEHVQLIERAKALLARDAPGKSLGQLHLQAMRLLVAALEKQKFAVTGAKHGGEGPREQRICRLFDGLRVHAF